MAGIAVGDRDALAILVSRYHSGLLGFLYRMTGGDRSVAEDLVQDTFVRVLTQRTFRVGRPVKPWLYAIATNLVRDRHRTVARRPQETCLSRIKEGHSAGLDPEALTIEREEEREIATAVLALGEEYRAALLLRYFHDLSLSQIAEVLGVPVGTVKSRISVGTRRLRELLRAREEVIR